MQSYSSDMPKIEEFVDLGDREMLEIGCGDGRLSSLLANKVKNLTAIDPDKAMINLASREISGVDFRVGNGEKLEFKDEEDLYYHFMDSFMVENDAEGIEKIKAILSHKKKERPIVIRDKVNIFLFKY